MEEGDRFRLNGVTYVMVSQWNPKSPIPLSGPGLRYKRTLMEDVKFAISATQIKHGFPSIVYPGVEWVVRGNHRLWVRMVRVGTEREPKFRLQVVPRRKLKLAAGPPLPR